MRFAALGRTRWLYDAVVACRERGHEVALIASAPAAPEYGVDEQDFAALAAQSACPFLRGPLSSLDAVAALRAAEADVAISVNWPTLLLPEALAAFPRGVLNAHAGDVPRFRGNAAPNWAIISGADSLAVVVMQMTVEVDAGPVLLRKTLPLDDRTYIADVYRFLDDAIPALFADALDGLEADALTPVPQPLEAGSALRGLPRLPVDGRLDWARPAVELARIVRASAEPFGGAYTFLGRDRLTVWRARAERPAVQYLGTPGQVAELRPRVGEVTVACGDGVLVLEEVELGGGGRCPAASVVTSARERLGLALEDEVARLEVRLSRLERLLSDPASPDA
jgi:methionyl-tRNA formyltransferase